MVAVNELEENKYTTYQKKLVLFMELSNNIFNVNYYIAELIS